MNLILLISIFILQIEDTLQLQYAVGNNEVIPNQYTPLPENFTPKIGQSYWVKIEIPYSKDEAYVIQGGKWYMRNMGFYNQNKELLDTGNYTKVPLHSRVNTFYIHYPFTDEKSSGISQIAAYNLLEFMEIKSKKDIIQASFQSILLFLILISIFLFLQSKDKVYLYYGLYLFSIMWFFSYQYGILGSIIPVVNNISPTWFWLFAFTTSLFYALFTLEYFQLKSIDLKAYKIIKWGIIYMFFLFFLSTLLYLFQIDVQHSYYYKIPGLFVQLLLIGAVLFRIMKFEGIIKTYYLVGVFILLFASVGGQILSTSQEMENFNYIIQAGLLLEIFVLSLGLGVRVDIIQKRHNTSSKALIKQLKLHESLQKEYTSKLEAKVNERTESLLKRTEENEMLLKEVHHRVKNNLQVIISLINMQERRVKSLQSKQILSSTKNKVKSIALIHEHLYQHENFTSIQLDEYIEKLVKMLIQNLHNGNEINIFKNIPKINIDFEKAIHIGLILNELTTNSIKYGFARNENPELKIDISNIQSALRMTVVDNGKNKPSNEKHKGLGFNIIQAIVEMGDGYFSYHHDEKGFSVQIEMNI